MILQDFDDLNKPIKEIWEKTNYTNTNFKSYMNLTINKRKIIQDFHPSINDMLLHSLRNYDNMKCIIFLNKSKVSTYNYIKEEYNDEYSILGIKEYEVNKKTLYNIMYQIFFDRLIINNKKHYYDFINNQYSIINEMDDEMKIKISFVITLIKRNDILWGEDKKIDNFWIIHPHNDQEKWLFSTVFLNENTMEFLKIQDFDFYYLKEYEENRNWFNNYRRFVLGSIDPIDQTQCLLFSSIILYFLGHRKNNDIDVMFYELKEENRIRALELYERHNHNIHSEKYNNTITQQDRSKYMDIYIKNTDKWHSYWDRWLPEWARHSGAKSFDEIVSNPNFHFYFGGVKIVSLHVDITRRCLRNRPRAIADLIALKIRYKYQVNIPTPPENKDEFFNLQHISEEKKNELLENGGIIMEEEQQIKITNKLDVNDFIHTVKWCLKERYRIELDNNDICRELNITKNVVNNEENKTNKKLGKTSKFDNNFTLRDIMEYKEETDRLKDKMNNSKSYSINNSNNSNNSNDSNDILITTNNDNEDTNISKEKKIIKNIRKIIKKNDVVSNVDCNVILNEETTTNKRVVHNIKKIIKKNTI